MRMFILPLLVIAASGSAFAQGSTLDKVYACTGITKAEDRLACFDGAVAGFKQAQAAGDVKVVTREQIAQGEKQAFGLRETAAVEAAQASAGTLPAQAAPAPIANVQVKIAGAAKRADGKYRFTLEDGQVWEQIDSDSVGSMKKLPLSAEIKTAFLGSFLMKIENGKTIRVRRVK